MRRISRAAAVATLEREPRPDCLVCAMVASGRRVIAAGRHAVAALDRFPRHWGHALVLARRHVTGFSDLAPGEWAEVAAMAARVAAALEAVIEPARVYVASLGSARGDLPMSSPHLHVHVIPVPDPDLRPREVLTWQGGVLEAGEIEWRRLERELASALP